MAQYTLVWFGAPRPANFANTLTVQAVFSVGNVSQETLDAWLKRLNDGYRHVRPAHSLPVPTVHPTGPQCCLHTAACGPRMHKSAAHHDHDVQLSGVGGRR